MVSRLMSWFGKSDKVIGSVSMSCPGPMGPKGENGHSGHILDVTRRTDGFILTAFDVGCFIEADFSKSDKCVIPSDDLRDFPIGGVVRIVKVGKGKVDITKFKGVKLSGSKFTLSKKYEMAEIIKCRENEWYVFISS